MAEVWTVHYNVGGNSARTKLQWADIITWSYNSRGSVMSLEAKVNVIMLRCGLYVQHYNDTQLQGLLLIHIKEKPFDRLLDLTWPHTLWSIVTRSNTFYVTLTLQEGLLVLQYCADSACQIMKKGNDDSLPDWPQVYEKLVEVRTSGVDVPIECISKINRY